MISQCSAWRCLLQMLLRILHSIYKSNTVHSVCEWLRKMLIAHMRSKYNLAFEVTLVTCNIDRSVAAVLIIWPRNRVVFLERLHSATISDFAPELRQIDFHLRRGEINFLSPQEDVMCGRRWRILKYASRNPSQLPPPIFTRARDRAQHHTSSFARLRQIAALEAVLQT
jgi:hypothetical protein